MIGSYRVRRNGDEVILEVAGTDNRNDNSPYVRRIRPEESLKYVNHSPTGFEFGYCGSGPAQLAFAILLDYSGQSKARQHYQNFKRDFIATMKSEGRVIQKFQIDHWLVLQRKGRP